MPTLSELFVVSTASGGGFSRYPSGDVAYISNGFKNNGVLGHVRPGPDDDVITECAIVVSAFCEATVQIPPFIARGNGGSGLVVLRPKQKMTTRQLAHVAAYLNAAVRWRFSWSRMATVDRLRNVEIPRPSTSVVTYGVRALLPTRSAASKPAKWRMCFREFPLASIFDMRAGDYHSTMDLPEGDVPLVSCGDGGNGICAFVDVPKEFRYSYRITIAFNGMNTLATKYHPYEFAAKDDVAVCTPFTSLRVSTLLFFQIMMRREQWRYNFYRKCFMEKLRRQVVSLPSSGGEIDEDTIEEIVQSSTYWPALKERLTPPNPVASLSA